MIKLVCPHCGGEEFQEQYTEIVYGTSFMKLHKDPKWGNVPYKEDLQEEDKDGYMATSNLFCGECKNYMDYEDLVEKV